MSALRTSLARGAAARVFVIEGANPPAPIELLRGDPCVHVLDSPRSATLLLVAGTLSPSVQEAARRIHDQMAHPRRTVHWCGHGDDEAAAEDRDVFPHAARLRATSAAVGVALQRMQAALIDDASASEPALLPDVDPNPWRGVGPYGQGGTGMAGGVPYGRPLAQTAPDRDGLQLDQLTVRVGPFFPPFPAGLVLELAMQGDLVQRAAVGANPFGARGVPSDDGGDPFREALDAPVAIAHLELARARHHLRHLAHLLHVCGLDALARRALAISIGSRPGDAAPLRALGRCLERTRALAVATEGVGHVAPASVRGRGLGPVARATGVADDARAEDPAYRALGFDVLTRTEGDARARWRQRLAEAVQSVELAGRAGDRRAGVRARIEAPRGVLTSETSPLSALLALVPPLLDGADWGDAVTTIVSLDLDLRDLPPHPPAAGAGRHEGHA